MDEEVKYGLSKEVVFCKKCVMSNQRPASTPEFGHTADIKHKSLNIQNDGVCDACHYAEQKEQIDWTQREKELIELLDQYRRNDGRYDCIVPGSGGKDSDYASFLLKYKYGMHPLTVTWPPILYTDIGYQNYCNWIEVGGVDNVTFKPNGKIIKLLTRLSIENLFHPFQTFILGQKNLAPKIAINYDVPLIFYGENEAEYGNPIADNASSLRDKSFYVANNISQLYLGGVSVKELMEKYKLELNDLTPFFPADYRDVEHSKIEVRYLGYYIKWTPQEAYYNAVEHSGFQANLERTEGTYSKYISLDDRIDGLHYYTTYIKYGIGRATYDASQEIRNKHLTREEGIALVNRFDGEFPKRYFKEIMNYIGLSEEKFFELEEKARSPHLWEKTDGKWILKHKVS